MLETALSADAPRVLAEELRRTLVSVLERLGEEEGVRDNCLIVAESALKRGETERGAEYLLRAASACERRAREPRVCSSAPPSWSIPGTTPEGSAARSTCGEPLAPPSPSPLSWRRRSAPTRPAL